MPPTLFFLEISLAIQASCMWFHTYFRVVYSISVTGSNQHFDDIESVDYFGQHGYFNSTIFFPQSMSMEYLSIICVFFNLFHQCLSFQCTHFLSLRLNLVPDILFSLIKL